MENQTRFYNIEFQTTKLQIQIYLLAQPTSRNLQRRIPVGGNHPITKFYNALINDTEEMSVLPRIILKKGKEKPLLRGHPWVFSGAVAKIEGEVSPGDIGEVYSKEGQFLGIGHLNPRSQIILRLLTQKKEELGKIFFRERISRAVILRESVAQRERPMPIGSSMEKEITSQG